MKYDSKVSTLDERDGIDLVTVDELHGILIAYEMKTWINKSSRKDEAFKASSKNQLENLDDEEVLFIKKLEKGTGKYKGKLPLKCFNCRRIGHFASKCTYPKQDDSDERENLKLKKGKMGNKKKSYEKKKIVYTMEDSEDGETKILFMGVDTQASNSDSNCGRRSRLKRWTC